MGMSTRFIQEAEKVLNEPILASHQVISKLAIQKRTNAAAGASGGLVGALISTAMTKKSPQKIVKGPEAEPGFLMMALTKTRVCFFAIDEGFFWNQLGDLRFEYAIDQFESFQRTHRRFSFPSQHQLSFQLNNGESFQLMAHPMPFCGSSLVALGDQLSDAISVQSTRCVA